MKILQVINNIAWGGAGNLLINYVPIMREMGHDVELLFLRKADCPHIDYFSQNGIKVSWLSENSLYNPLLIYKVRAFVKKGNFDIVHVHLFPALYHVGLAAYLGLGRSKLVYTEHSTNNKRRNKLFCFFDKIAYNKYDLIICITNLVQENITSHLKGLCFKYKTILNGVNLQRFKSEVILQRKDLYEGYMCSHKLIVMVARMSEPKDHVTLLKAMALLPSDCHLLLLGEGENKGMLKNTTLELGIENRVHFLGVRNDVPDILRLCDIGVLSSGFEGLPIAAIEIMAAGIPFVGSKVPGIQDLIEAEKDGAGVLYTHKNAEDLASHIKKLLQDKDYYETVCTAGRNRAMNYSIEKMTEQYIYAYQELMGNDKQR